MGLVRATPSKTAGKGIQRAIAKPTAIPKRVPVRAITSPKKPAVLGKPQPRLAGVRKPAAPPQRIARHAPAEEVPAEGPSFCRQDFTLGNQIGAGHFGSVHLAMEKKSKRQVVLKILRKRDLREARFQDQVQREVELQTHLVHDNILRAYAYFDDAQYLYLVLEHAAQGSLRQLLRHDGPRREMRKDAARVVRELCHALSFCHERDVIHRDVKLENILIDKDSTVKLADFGWAVRSKKKRTTLCGTPEYFAPEIVEKRPYDSLVDVWCVGVVAHELLLGHIPARQQLSASDAKLLPATAADFLRTVLVPANQRPRLPEVLAHPWLAAPT